MKKDKHKTVVVFRRWKNKPETVIAIFPFIMETSVCCRCYEHLGQHSICDYQAVMNQTRPIYNELEIKDGLKRELENFGYNLDVRVRK